jgi:Holliday junction DNA helicase RuvA
VIARLRGKPAARADETVVIDVGGVGYLIHATRSVLSEAQRSDELVVETYLHVREDALQLYGFSDAEERILFEQLLSVSGVGPKVALAIVSGSSPRELHRAIVLEDTARFQAIPGIGKKTAQRVVLELKEKLAADVGPIPLASARGPDSVARDALVELGFSPGEAEHALAATDPELPPEERVRQALKAA